MATDTGLDFADPDVMTTADGYVLAGTTTRDNQTLHVPAAWSSDLLDWSSLVDLLPVFPEWAIEN